MSRSPLSPANINALRQAISSQLAEYKAYELPGVCVRYGLAGGTGDEAFSGKYRYVLRRVTALPAEEVLKIARAILAEEENAFELSEAVAKIDERSGRTISEVTRRRLVECLMSEDLPGKLFLESFLERICPINSVSSRNSSGTIGEAIRLYAGGPDWNNGDTLAALGIHECSQGFVFRILEELTHPVTRGEAEQRRLAAAINDVLKPDGFALVENGRLSGSPVFKVKEIGADGETPADSGIHAVLTTFDESGVREVWERALERRSSDPEGAITLARTFLEDICKRIIENAGECYTENGDLPKLYRQAAKTLRLAPDDHTEEAFKKILGSCQNIVETLGTLRNRLGDAHGAGRRRVKPQARHAQLAVNLAGAMSLFLITTWEERQRQKTELQSSSATLGRP